MYTPSKRSVKSEDGEFTAKENLGAPEEIRPDPCSETPATDKRDYNRQDYENVRLGVEVNKRDERCRHDRKIRSQQPSPRIIRN